MKKNMVFPVLLAIAALTGAQAKAQQPDSLSFEQLEQAIVSGVRVQKNAPYAVSNVNRSALQDFSGSGREIPFLLSSTPGVLSWSENGVGTGTTYMRIRGAGDSRINVTIDGVPLNSPEDQCVFWANMNSYSALLESIQVQRGVGTSTNGDGAFGGSVALRTKSISYEPSVELNASYGSFNTFNTGISASTGLIGNHFVLDGAFHTTGTDGYVHGTDGNSGSWLAGVTWIGRDLIIKYKNIGNYEHTGQAWNGVTAGNDDLSLMDGTYGAEGFRTYTDMYKAGLGKYNSLYESLSYDGDAYAFNKDAAGNYIVNRHALNDGSFWARTTDNFWQDHNILSAAWQMSERWKSTLSLHYTYGYGYYDEFRPNNKLSKFGLATIKDAAGNKIKRTDFVRQKGLSQNTTGLVYNVSYTADRLEVIGGLSGQVFSGNHFGYLTYIASPDVAKSYGLESLNDTKLSDGRYKYYDSDAVKTDVSAFAKASCKITPVLTAFGDVQFRHVGYKTSGINDKFIEQEDGSYKNQELSIDANYNFVNPKAGLSFDKGGNHAYASIALASREPERNNFTDNGSYPAPRAEHLTDFELGYQYNGKSWNVSANAYFMDYTDQFVQTGAQSDIGENLTTNIKDSYRAGIELSAGAAITDWLSIDANAALSQNKILDFDEVVEDWDNGSQTIHYDNSTLAFSPSAILNGFVTVHKAGFKAAWHTSYVSRQFLDNTQCEARSLPAYSLSGLRLSYEFTPCRLIRNIELALDLNNVFNAHVATSGWVYSAIYESGGHPNDNRYYQIGFIPTAGFTALGSVRLRF